MTKISTLITANFQFSPSDKKKLIQTKDPASVKASTLDFLVNYSRNLQIEPSSYIGKFEFLTS
jgi:hypothetical protein